MLVKRRLANFVKNSRKRNKVLLDGQAKKELPATIDTVQKHVAKQIETAGKPPDEKFFNLSKNNKEDPPLTGFVEYFAYRMEQYKYDVRQEQLNFLEGVKKGGASKNQAENKISKPGIFKMLLDYAVEKKFDRQEYFITKS